MNEITHKNNEITHKNNEITHWNNASGVTRIRVLGPAEGEHVLVEDLDNGGTWDAHESQLVDWRGRAAIKLDETPIFVDDLGRPVGDRPEVHAFEDYGDFLSALGRYRQAAADAINAEFSRALRVALLD